MQKQVKYKFNREMDSLQPLDISLWVEKMPSVQWRAIIMLKSY